MSNVYIVAAKRTAIGGFLGTLSGTPARKLGSVLVQDILEETGLNGSEVDEVIIGHVLPAGQGQGVARQIAIDGGIPATTCAYGVNMVCGSGMKAIMNGYNSILLGERSLVLAGGVEAMSMAPYLLPSSMRSGRKMGSFDSKDHMVDDALMDCFNDYHMGVTAENIAERHNLSRDEQDAFAMESQKRSIEAVDSGRFKEEITPVVIKTRKGEVVFDTDEYPNRTTNLEKLGKLKTVFKKDGTVTAGNASGINDGGSMVLLASKEAIELYNLKPLAKIVSVGQGGVEPSVMGLGPVPAIADVLKKADMSLSQMELIELNEAFAAQSLGVITELEANHDLDKNGILERCNVNGGAIALGHPLGASGNRIVVTLIHEMIKRKAAYGLASLCIGGGMGTAVILELV